MEQLGGSGRGGRWYGDELDVLRGRLSDDERIPCYCAETSTRNCPRHAEGDPIETPEDHEEEYETR